MLILFLALTQICWAQKEIQFRWVLTKKEEASNCFAADTYISKNGKELSVNRDALLARSDIEKISLIRDQSGTSRLLIQLTDNGRKKYREATEKNPQRQLAVTIGDELLTDFRITRPETSGRVCLALNSMGEGERIMKSLGLSPRFEYQL